jgi:DNA-binding MarR family transcriptional regulator
MARSDLDNLGFLIADISRAMRRAFQRRIEGSSLTLAQARALVYVARNEGIRQVDLAELLEVQPMTLARLLDQLAAAGLVERRTNPSDRRAYQIHLTPAATPHLEAIHQVVATIRKEVTRGFAEEELDTVLAALRRMRDNLPTR